MKYLIPVIAFLVCLQSSRAQSPVSDTGTGVTVYLTFDDGPVKTSWHLVDLIRADSLPVTVFLVGRYVFSSSTGMSIFRYYRDNPVVEIANHSYSHARNKYKKYYAKPGLVVSDILKNEDSLHLREKIVRLPGRNTWRINGRQRTDLTDTRLAADSLMKLGYRIFGWDAEWRYDTVSQSYLTARQLISVMDFLVRHHCSFTPGHIVILCHDTMLGDEWARQQMGLFITEIRARNWKMKTLRDYPGCRDSQPVLFETYRVNNFFLPKFLLQHL